MSTALPRQADLVIDGASFVLTMDEGRSLHEDAGLAVLDGAVAEVGPSASIRANWIGDATEVIDGSDCLVTPGLINAHTHLESCFDKGLMGGVPVQPFVERYYAFTYGTLDPETYEDAALVNLLGCLKTGTTTIADCGTLPGMEASAARAVERIGARAVLARCLMDVHDEPVDPKLAELGADVPRESTDDCLDRASEFLDRYDGAAAGRITAALDLQSLTNCTPDLVRDASTLAERGGHGLHSHVAWSSDAVELTRRRFGATDVEYLARMNALSPRLAAAHAICVDARESQLLREAGSSVVHVPASSMFFAQGAVGPASPFPAFSRLGVNIALGNDELSTGTCHDLVRDMWLTSVAHQEARQARSIPDRDLFVTGPDDASPPVLEMATLNGATALGLETEIGSIETGKRADLVLWDLTSYEWLPTVRANLVPNLIQNGTGRSVKTVICDGNVVVANGEAVLVDEGELRSRVQEAAERITPAAPWLQGGEGWTLEWSAGPGRSRKDKPS